MDQRILAVVVALVVVAAFLILLTPAPAGPEPKAEPEPEPEPEPLPVACTMDAKICPDGSAVGRVGPDCEFEECPEPQAFATKVGEAANALWGNTGIIYYNTNEVADEGWLRNSFTVPDQAELSSECYIFMRGESQRQAEGGRFVENGEQFDGTCQLQFHYANCNMFIKLDLESMKTGYSAEEDNWDEFITCVGDGEFCQEECGRMLEILMMQEREPLQ